MIRLRASHRDLSGTVRQIFIYDRELGASTTDTVVCTEELYTLKWEGDRNDIFKRIIPCTASFTIYTEHPTYSEAARTAVQSFYNDIATSYEGRFYIRCQYGEDLGQTVQEFMGKILPDIGEMVLDHYRTVTFTAIDGITGLKDIEYRPDGYSDTDPIDAIRITRFKDHIHAILIKNDVVEYFQDTINAFGTSLFTTSGHWTESRSTPGDGDIWNRVMVRNFFFEQISPTYRKYKSCYDVLEQLLTGFVARCIYADGKYHIEQLSYQDNLTPIIYGYNYDGNAMVGTYYDAKTQHTIWGSTESNLQVLTWPSRKWLAPIKAIELTSGKQFTNYINGLYVAATTPGWGGSGTLDFGPQVLAGSKLVTQLNAEFILGTSGWTWAATVVMQFTLRFKIKIGDFFLKVQNTDEIIGLSPDIKYHVTSNGIPVLEWTLTDSTITLQWQKVFASINSTDLESQFTAWRQHLQNASIVLESLEIQEDGDFIIEMIDFIHSVNGSPIGGSPPALWVCKSSSRIIFASGYSDLYEKPKGIKRYEVADIRNTLLYKVDLSYYDSDLVTMEQLFLWSLNDLIDSPFEQAMPTTEWTDPDASLTLPIEDLMMKTMVAMRKYPAQTLEMDVYFREDDRISLRDRVAIDGELYLITEMELNAGSGIYKVILWRLYKDYLGINVVDTGEPEPETPAPLPDGSLDAASPGGNLTGVEFYQEWTNVTDNYVNLSVFLADYLPDTDTSIKTKWHLYINGVRQRYVDASPVIRTWRFLNPDPSINRIEFFKGSGAVSHIELIKYY